MPVHSGRVTSGLRVLHGNPGLRLFCGRPGLWLLCLGRQRPGLWLVATKKILEEVREEVVQEVVQEIVQTIVQEVARQEVRQDVMEVVRGVREVVKEVLGRCWRSSSSRQTSNGGVCRHHPPVKVPVIRDYHNQGYLRAGIIGVS